MTYRRKDAHYRRARAAGYRARSAYKLVELDRRYGLLHPGDFVVDLGAWNEPGGCCARPACRLPKWRSPAVSSPCRISPKLIGINSDADRVTIAGRNKIPVKKDPCKDEKISRIGSNLLPPREGAILMVRGRSQ